MSPTFWLFDRNVSGKSKPADTEADRGEKSDPTPTFWLLDKNVPDELKTAYAQAARDKSVSNAMARLFVALHAFIDEAGPHIELQNAVQSSLEAGSNLVEQILKREAEIFAQIEAIKTEKRLHEGMCFARRVEVLPVINACISEASRLVEDIKTLEKQIDGFERSRAESIEKYRSAGLGDTDIKAIGGVKPTYGDLAEWKVDLKEKRSRQEQISRFLSSAPDYHTSLLDAVAGTEATANERGT